MFSILLFVCLCLSGGVRNELISIGLEQAWSDQGPLQQRKLSQDTNEQIRMSTDQCNPSTQDCSGKEACMDIKPPDSGSLQCSDFAQNNFCDRLAKEFCAISCGFCCTDEQPNYVSCEEVAQGGLCETVLKDGKCNKSCGQCPKEGDNSQYVTPAPSPTNDSQYDPWAPVTINVAVADVVKECTTAATAAIGNPELSTLVAALEQVGLVATLDDPAFVGTVLAPTNEAFDKLIAQFQVTTEELLADPQLGNILLYHVIYGVAILSTDLSDGDTATTLLEQDLSVEVSNETITFVGAGSSANVIVAGTVTCEAIIHVIDKVLLPDFDLITAQAAAAPGNGR